MNEYSNEIDLGQTPPEATATLGASKKGKPKKYYPALYISGVEGLDGLPKEGKALIYFKRGPLTTREDDESTTHSTELEVTKICLPESSDETEEYLGNDEDEFDKAARKAGIETGKKAKDEDED